MQKLKINIIAFIGLGLFHGWAVNAVAAPAPIITSTQERSEIEGKPFGIGLTSSLAQRPFVGVNDQDASLLYLSYQYKRFYIEGLDVGFNLYKNDSYTLDVLGTPRFYESEPAFAGNGELNGIDITKRTYFGGLSSQIKTDFATYTVQILHDLLESDGNELVVQLSKHYKMSDKFSLAPSVGITYQDDKLVDHFYGVQANEVIAGRPLYVGQGSLNYNVTLNASWNVTEQIELLGQVKYEILGDGITDSPIVDESGTYNFTVGAVYRFK